MPCKTFFWGKCRTLESCCMRAGAGVVYKSKVPGFTADSRGDDRSSTPSTLRKEGRRKQSNSVTLYSNQQ